MIAEETASESRPPQPPEAVVQARKLSRTYVRGVQRIEVLRDVTFDAYAGELVLIAGVSGSGKTTLLNLLAGLDDPDGGELEVLGHVIQNLTRTARDNLRLTQIGFVFQEANLVPDLTAHENVQLILRAAGRAGDESRMLAGEALDRVGLAGLHDRYPRELSGGQAQRVGIARAVAGDRPVILADEPTGSVDHRNSIEIFELFRSLADDGRSIVLSSHDPQVRDIAHRAFDLTDGVLEPVTA